MRSDRCSSMPAPMSTTASRRSGWEPVPVLVPGLVPGAGARAGARADGPIVPVLYGGQDEQAAASETIFHTVDTPTGARRPRQVLLATFLSWQRTRIAPTRDLVLVDLRDAGLAALGFDRAHVIDGGRPSHPQTRRWAAGLLRACRETDGLVWSSRQDPSRQAVMLAGRVRGRSGGVRPASWWRSGPPSPSRYRPASSCSTPSPIRSTSPSCDPEPLTRLGPRLLAAPAARPRLQPHPSAHPSARAVTRRCATSPTTTRCRLTHEESARTRATDRRPRRPRTTPSCR